MGVAHEGGSVEGHLRHTVYQRIVQSAVVVMVHLGLLNSSGGLAWRRKAQGKSPEVKFNLLDLLSNQRR